MKIIGREGEKKILSGLLKSPKAELLAVYGRRRVGKTYLVRSFFSEQLVFTCTGQLQADTTTQLANFKTQLNVHFKKQLPANSLNTWREAFEILNTCLEKQKNKKAKQVLFFDELPWLDNHKSGFLSAFDYFWNVHASVKPNLLVVVCGSSASWIIKNVINNTGGLHNRVTAKMRLLPFSLLETDQYLSAKKIKTDRYSLLQLYMIMGGVPHYLNAIEKGKSVQQNIEKICFSKDGLLANEFNNLFLSLFSNGSRHIKIVKALCSKNKGLSRNELARLSGLKSGGGLSDMLDELEESGFILAMPPFGKKTKDSLYRVVDGFSTFYFNFMMGSKSHQKNAWLKIAGSQRYKIWCGYAFENVCITHSYQIKKALGISGIYTEDSVWSGRGNNTKQGAQVDLLIDRADNCITLCETKFHNKPFVIDKSYAQTLKRKKQAFITATKTTKTIMLAFITTYGVSENSHKTTWADNDLTMDVLFA